MKDSRACVVMAVLAGPAMAQSTWTVRGGEAAVRLVKNGAVAEGHVLGGPAPQSVVTTTGRWSVHFGVDAAGKPRSSTFDVNDGDDVHLAVDPAGAAKATVVANDDASWRRVEHGSGRTTAFAITGANDVRAGRVVGEFVVPGSETVGLVARWNDATQHYRCAIDAARGEVRLERLLGGDLLVLARAATSIREGDVVHLAMQVEGFRIVVFVDDAIVLQTFDGAHEVGAVGTWTTGADPRAACRRFTIGAPAAPRDSVALVRSDGSAAFHLATTTTPGSFAIVEILLDRSGPPLPTIAGIEPWLVREPAAPRVLLADLRGSLGTNAFAEIPPDGVVAATLRWPPGRLAGRCVLVRSLLVAADGGAKVGASPAVLLQF